jgi:predicted 3-demethylubiquinone-9 3-methyltransferase (glyoxalase superfamily)
MSVTFQLDGRDFYALNGGPHFTFTPALSFFVNCETQQEVDELGEKLSARGKKTDAAGSKTNRAFRGKSFPQSSENCSKTKTPGSQKMSCNATLQMDKIDVKTLTQAYDDRPEIKRLSRYAQSPGFRGPSSPVAIGTRG